VKEHGRKWVPLLVAAGLLAASAVGWGLATTMRDLYGM
jgi:hypothetical protein